MFPYLELEHHGDEFDVLGGGEDPVEAHEGLAVHLLHALTALEQRLLCQALLAHELYSSHTPRRIPSSFASRILQYSWYNA